MIKTLIKDSTGKWHIGGKEFTSGNTLKAKYEGKEISGRIEYSDKLQDYFFKPKEEPDILIFLNHIKVLAENKTSYKPLVKNSYERWQVAEQTLRVSSTLYLYLGEYGWQFSTIQYCNKKKMYYFVTKKRISTDNKQLALYLDNDFNFNNLEARTVAEQEALIKEARASEQEAI